MPLHADLYLDRIDLFRYADTETCQVCRVDSQAELLDRLRSGEFCSGRCRDYFYYGDSEEEEDEE
jgi:hypothetical protein